MSAAIVASAALVLGGCSAGGGGDENVTLSILVDNTDTTINTVQALADAFTAANPNIKVELEERPQGSEGDNVVRTRLQTSDMTDLFYYNSGAQFQGLSPETTLADLSGEDFMKSVSDVFQSGVSAGDGVYGVPVGNAMGGGILYNKTVYANLGLEVPKTWDDFMANNKVIREAGIDPVIQTFGPDSTWTSQLFVLGDFYNVLADNPKFAEDFTANKAHFSDTPAVLGSLQKQVDVLDAGYLNADYGSATYADGLKKLAEGTGAQYPMLTFAVTEFITNYPDAVKDIGFFAIPGDNADSAGLTTWLSAAL
ncbi:MAG TPA: extracellular solute-binding protein, partial [Terrimesophilobacter sp.]|uniref:ABC transporter substrate-binding protein n=1 Tax=Terrimesophilobacter sp. TaxID=2906435 RepID=UPI002F945C50